MLRLVLLSLCFVHALSTANSSAHARSKDDRTSSVLSAPHTSRAQAEFQVLVQYIENNSFVYHAFIFPIQMTLSLFTTFGLFYANSHPSTLYGWGIAASVISLLNMIGSSYLLIGSVSIGFLSTGLTNLLLLLWNVLALGEANKAIRRSRKRRKRKVTISPWLPPTPTARQGLAGGLLLSGYF